MAGPQRSVVIVGAGIAGLTLALALAKFGVRVVVLERHDRPTEIGAGLQIASNARRVLDRLGLGPAVSKVAIEPEGIAFTPLAADHAIATLALGKPFAERFGAPYVVMHRGDLLGVLAQATRSFANIELVMEVNEFAITDHPGGVIVDYVAAGNTSRLRAFAALGADGVNSRLRTQVIGGPAARFDGYVVWRTLLDVEAISDLLPARHTGLFAGPGYHAVCYPLPNRDAVNVALFARQPSGTTELPPAPVLPASASRSRFFTRLMSRPTTWRAWPVGQVETDTWSKGSVGLIGDAAHAMLPFQAQGAAMAIEDAAVLAPLLGQAETATDALSRYAAARRDRVERVRRVSARNGEIFHMHGPAALARDAVIRLQGPFEHFRRLGWLYDYDAEAGAASREAAADLR